MIILLVRWGMGCLICFGLTLGLRGNRCVITFLRLYKLAENKFETVVVMFARGWGVNEEAWKWRRRLFAWEDELLGECNVRLTTFSFQVDRVNRSIWKLHGSNCYIVSSAYFFF